MSHGSHGSAVAGGDGKISGFSLDRSGPRPREHLRDAAMAPWHHGLAPHLLTLAQVARPAPRSKSQVLETQQRLILTKYNAV